MNRLSYLHQEAYKPASATGPYVLDREEDMFGFVTSKWYVGPEALSSLRGALNNTSTEIGANFTNG